MKAIKYLLRAKYGVHVKPPEPKNPGYGKCIYCFADNEDPDFSQCGHPDNVTFGNWNFFSGLRKEYGDCSKLNAEGQCERFTGSQPPGAE